MLAIPPHLQINTNASVLDQEKDPFAVDPNEERHVGSSTVWLKSLSYMIEIQEQLELVDYKGDEMGLVNVEVLPCDKKGKVLKPDDVPWVDKPSELVGKDAHFLFKLTSGRGLPKKFTVSHTTEFIQQNWSICSYDYIFTGIYIAHLS